MNFTYIWSARICYLLHFYLWNASSAFQSSRGRMIHFVIIRAGSTWGCLSSAVMTVAWVAQPFWRSFWHLEHLVLYHVKLRKSPRSFSSLFGRLNHPNYSFWLKGAYISISCSMLALLMQQSLHHPLQRDLNWIHAFNIHGNSTVSGHQIHLCTFKYFGLN